MLSQKIEIGAYFLLSLLYATSGFVGSPGIEKHNIGDSALFLWDVSDHTFPVVYSIRKGWYDKMSTVILTYTVTHNDSVCAPSNPRLNCTRNGMMLGFTLNNVEESDAGRYNCEATLNVGITQHNSNATLYIYKPPNIPVIMGILNVHENQSTTLSCYAKSASLPEAFRLNTSEIEYTWSSSVPSDIVNATSSTIGPVNRCHNKESIICIAIDNGADQGSDSNVTLNVWYPPFIPTIHKPVQLYYLEGRDNLTLSCFFPVELGNPAADRLVWQRVDGLEQPKVTTDGVLEIPGSNVSVVLHDGLWQCWANSSMQTNPGEPDQVMVEVYSRPTIRADKISLTEGEDFKLNCSVTKHPKSNVAFLHTVRGSTVTIPPTSQDGNTALYTAQSVGCLNGGVYKCRAENDIIMPPAASDDINVFITCAPSQESIEPPSGTSAARPGQSVRFEVGLISNPLTESHLFWSFAPNGLHTSKEHNLSGTQHSGLANQRVANTLPNGTQTYLDGQTAILSIEAVTDNHFGSYELEVNNTIGQPFMTTFTLKNKVGDSSAGTNWILIGAVVGVVAACVVTVVAIVVLWRKGIICNNKDGVKRRQQPNSKSGDDVKLRRVSSLIDDQSKDNELRSVTDPYFQITGVPSAKRNDRESTMQPIPYENVEFSQGHRNGKKKTNAKPIQRVGADGIVYADLELTTSYDQTRAGPTKSNTVPVIHGSENLTEYASIDLKKLKKK